MVVQTCVHFVNSNPHYRLWGNEFFSFSAYVHAIKHRYMQIIYQELQEIKKNIKALTTFSWQIPVNKLEVVGCLASGILFLPLTRQPRREFHLKHRLKKYPTLSFVKRENLPAIRPFSWEDRGKYQIVSLDQLQIRRCLPSLHSLSADWPAGFGLDQSRRAIASRRRGNRAGSSFSVWEL